MQFVFNEWFAEYICSTNERQTLILDILERMKVRGDVLVVAHGSPFFQKLCGLNKGQVSPGLRLFFRILYDSDRVQFVYPDKMPPMDTAVLETIPTKDRYLVHIMSITRDKVLITTDGPLWEAVNRIEGYTARLLEDFIPEYLKRGDATSQ